MIKRFQKPNEMCSCNSGKKYKKCCYWNTQEDMYQYAHHPPIINGSQTSSDVVQECIDLIKQWNPACTVHDITSQLTPARYRSYQLSSIDSKEVLVAQRTPESEEIFKTRIQSNAPEDFDLIIMRAGHYRIVESSRLLQYEQSIREILN